MRITKKITLIGALLISPLIMTGLTRSVNASQVSVKTNQVQPVKRAPQQNLQQVANQQPKAVRNSRSRFARDDSQYWTNRINRAAYLRRNYRYPLLNWNARDLGGYYAGHGKWTKPGVVYRGGDLSRISRRGINQLKKLGINYVMDLRSYHHQGGADPGEDQPNRPNPLGVKYVEDVVNTRAEKRELAPYKRMYGGERYKYATSFLTWYTARRAYHNVFMQLLNHKRGAVYFHCIDGEDRTGIVAILYLSALGVSKRRVYNDYLLTDYYDHKHSYRYEASQIGTFYWGIHHYYKSMDHYLTDPYGLNLSHNEIKQLRKMYLVDRKY